MIKNKYKNRHFLFVPYLSAIFCTIILVAMGICGLPLFHLVVYTFVLLLIFLSLVVMKYKSLAVGMHLYFTVSFLGTLFFQIFRVDSDSYFSIYLILFLYFVALAIFLMEEPVNIAFVTLFSLGMAYEIYFDSALGFLRGTFSILFLFLTVLILYEAKKWLSNLSEYKIDSLKKMHDATIRILGKVSEIRDEETTSHLHRVEVMIEELILCLIESGQYKDYLTQGYLEDIKSAAFLHDIGKMGLPDRILNKEGSLTEEEFTIIKTHTIIGHSLLVEAKKEIEEESIYDLALEIARHHHEKWDGTGYPDNLRGVTIPLSARIMAIVDVYDALISKRPYKEAFSHEKAIGIIKERSGTHFDPIIAQVFLENECRIKMRIKHFENCITAC